MLPFYVLLLGKSQRLISLAIQHGSIQIMNPGVLAYRRL